MTICLAMLVKDNPEVVARSLRSARPFVDTWIIMVNKGDADALRGTVKRALGDLPGELLECPWVSMGANQTLLFAMARPRADYTLVFDGDDLLEAPEGFRLPELTADVYRLQVLDGPITYPRRQLFKNTLAWRSEGAYHETQVADGVCTEETLKGLTYRRCHDGARGSDPVRHAKFAAGLEAEMLKDPTNTRNAFYLAQCYRDCGNVSAAIAAYEKRVKMGGWDQEVYCSLLQIGRLLEMLRGGDAVASIRDVYLRAFNLCPKRAEAPYAFARFCRLRGEYELAYVFAGLAAACDRSPDDLFAELDVYTWQALDEWAIAAYWTGRDADAIALNELLLRSEALPKSEHARILSNRQFSLTRRAAHQAAHTTETLTP
jgi:hypothetical protein